MLTVFFWRQKWDLYGMNAGEWEDDHFEEKAEAVASYLVKNRDIPDVHYKNNLF